MNNLSQNRFNNATGDECTSGASWGTILVGVTIAIALGFILNLLGVGLGFASFVPDKEAIKNISTATMSWLFLGNLIAMLVGGCVAAILGNLSCKAKGFWYGFVVASLSMLIFVAIATTAIGGLVNGTFGVLSKGVSSSSEATVNISEEKDSSSLLSLFKSFSSGSSEEAVNKMKDALPESFSPMIDQIANEVSEFVDSASEAMNEKMPSAEEAKAKAEQIKAKAKEAKKELVPAVYHFVDSINTPQYDDARKNLLNKLWEISGKSSSDLQQMIDKWQSAYETAKGKAVEIAKQAAEKTASFMAKLALINFFIFLSGVIMAGIGGILGVVWNEKRFG